MVEERKKKVGSLVKRPFYNFAPFSLRSKIKEEEGRGPRQSGGEGAMPPTGV
jgi:hypothetical protein